MRAWLVLVAACHGKPPPEKVLEAVRRGDDAELARLLDDGADPNALPKDETDRPLAIAVTENHPKAVELLLAHHADPNLSNVSTSYSHGHPPLFYAAWRGDLPAVRALVAAGARIDGDDGDEETPLTMAAEGSHVDAIDALIALHASVEGHGDNGHGYPPLALAAEKGCLDCVKHLLAAGAKIDRRDGLGMTALNYACAKEQVDLVTLLLDAHADPLVANRAGWTPAFTCYYHDKRELEAAMRAHGVTDFKMHDPADTGPSGMGTISVPVVEVKGP